MLAGVAGLSGIALGSYNVGYYWYNPTVDDFSDAVLCVLMLLAGLLSSAVAIRCARYAMGKSAARHF